MNKLLITLPCYNEELVLEKSAKIIVDYAEKNLSNYGWRMLVLDNASEDKTYDIAVALSGRDGRIFVDQCSQKGRGAALSMAWQKYQGYGIYSYMDIDLATDIKDFRTLLTKIDDGHDIAVGSRYIPGAGINRSFKREFLSRIYNFLLKIFFNVKFKDAQCGFKAYRGEVVSNIIPQVEDTGWFWDTESMILAERKGYKICEIPVTWREVRDELRQSKVSPFVEVVKQLKNIVRLRIRLWLHHAF